MHVEKRTAMLKINLKWNTGLKLIRYTNYNQSKLEYHAKARLHGDMFEQ